MKLRSLLLVCFVLFSIVCLSQVDCKRNVDDGDEFSEFDSLDDSEANNLKKKDQQKQAASEQKKKQTADDFASFDNEIGEETSEEREDEEFERPKKTSKQAQQQQQQQQQQKAKTEQKKDATKQQEKKRGAVVNEDLDGEEFEHFIDDEEFETFDSAENVKDSKSKQKQKQKIPLKDQKMPDLKIADVPKHLMSNGNWQNYIYEIMMLVIIFIYFVNYIVGKSKNYRLANAWYQAHKDMLERNFAVVGDDGSSKEPPLTINKTSAAANSADNSHNDDSDENAETPSSLESEISNSQPTGTLIKESENSYGLWCTGRLNCDGMFVQMKFVKRQDLINGVIMQLVKPQSDQIIFTVEYPNHDDIDSFVFCLANKKTASHLHNNLQDLSSYCTSKKVLPVGNSGSINTIDYKYAEYMSPQVANKYVLLNELNEVPNYILDQQVCKFIAKYPDMIDYLLISDQFVGLKSPSGESDQATPAPNDAAGSSNAVGLPNSRCMLMLCINVSGKGFNTSTEDMENLHHGLQLIMHLMDKAPRIRLSREAKEKGIKNRKQKSELLSKLTQKQRQEELMLRKEEKKRAEKEKIMNESDPEKQRKMEEKEQKREKRKNLSKMKQIKVKAM